MERVRLGRLVPFDAVVEPARRPGHLVADRWFGPNVLLVQVGHVLDVGAVLSVVTVDVLDVDAVVSVSVAVSHVCDVDAAVVLHRVVTFADVRDRDFPRRRDRVLQFDNALADRLERMAATLNRVEIDGDAAVDSNAVLAAPAAPVVDVEVERRTVWDVFAAVFREERVATARNLGVGDGEFAAPVVVLEANSGRYGVAPLQILEVHPGDVHVADALDVHERAFEVLLRVEHPAVERDVLRLLVRTDDKEALYRLGGVDKRPPHVEDELPRVVLDDDGRLHAPRRESVGRGLVVRVGRRNHDPVSRLLIRDVVALGERLEDVFEFLIKRLAGVVGHHVDGTGSRAARVQNAVVH